MSIRQLKTLIAIEKYGTFSAAGEAICVTHAAVSQQMKSLEEQWQVQVFDRTTRTPTLTPTGRALVEGARSIVDSYDNLLSSVIDDKGIKGELLLGAVHTTLTGLVPLAVSMLNREYPELHVRVVPGLSNELIKMIDRGTIDAAILSHPGIIQKSHSWNLIAVEPLELLASENSESDDPLQLLRNSPFIRFSRDAVVGELIERWFEEEGIEVNDIMELESLESISSMVLSELGVSIAPKCCVQSMNPLPLKRLALPGSSAVRRLGLLNRKSSVKLRIVNQVHDVLKEAVLNGKVTLPGKTRTS